MLKKRKKKIIIKNESATSGNFVTLNSK